MSNYTFKHIEQGVDLDFQKPTIWVLNAHKTPPHIGISTAGFYFSLKANGKDEKVTVQTILDLIDRRTIPTVFIQLQHALKLDEISHIYLQFDKAGTAHSTCLTPITQLLNQQEAKQLAQLLTLLNDTIASVSGVNLPMGYMQLPSYSVAEIHQHIDELKVYVGE